MRPHLLPSFSPLARCRIRSVLDVLSSIYYVPSHQLYLPAGLVCSGVPLACACLHHSFSLNRSAASPPQPPFQAKRPLSSTFGPNKSLRFYSHLVFRSSQPQTPRVLGRCRDTYLNPLFPCLTSNPLRETTLSREHTARNHQRYRTHLFQPFHPLDRAAGTAIPLEQLTLTSETPAHPWFRAWMHCGTTIST